MSVVALPDLNTLPADALRALILAQHEQLISREREIEHLKLLLAKLHRMQFGRKSEKLQRQIEQLELRLEELESHRREKERNAGRTSSGHRLFDSCGSESHATRSAGSFSATNAPARAEGNGVPAMPGRAEKAGRRCFRDVGVCARQFRGDSARAHEAELHQVRLHCAGGGAQPSDCARGMAGPGLLAHVLVSKYCDHLPLYRQSEIYARQDVELERSTLADWVGGSTQLLERLVEALRRYVTAASKLHADDTPVPVLAPGNGKTKTGRLWTYVRDDRPAGDTAAPAVWFAYSPDRKGEHPERHLEKFRGTLQADAYAGFNQLYENGRIEQAACWAHYLESGIIQSESSGTQQNGVNRS